MVAATEKLYTFEKSAKIFAEAKVSVFLLGVIINKLTVDECTSTDSDAGGC